MALIGFLFISMISSAWARVDVLPKRLIFEPGTRTAMVTLINRSNQTYTYRMGWEDLVYTDEGVKRIDEGAQRVTPAASDFVRFAPRQVVLAPGESQSIRVLLQRPANLAAGEYRSHFLFQRQAEVLTHQTAGDNNQGVALNIQFAMGISIPIIVRAGEGEPEVSIIQASIHQTPENQQLHLQLARSGAYSSYADIELWEHGATGSRLLAKGNELALNADQTHYKFRLPLAHSPGNGVLQVQVSYSQRTGNSLTLTKQVQR